MIADALGITPTTAALVDLTMGRHRLQEQQQQQQRRQQERERVAGVAEEGGEKETRSLWWRRRNRNGTRCTCCSRGEASEPDFSP